MPILKTYTGKNTVDILFEIRFDYSDRNFSLYKDLVFQEIINKLKPTLIEKDLMIFIDPAVSEEELKYLIESEDDLILVMTKIDKRTKIFKTIKNISSVESCDPLKSSKDKNKFIDQIFKELSISQKYKYPFRLASSESRSRIYNEAVKLKTAIEVLDDPTSCIISDLGSYDIFKLLEALLNKDINESLRIYTKMEHDLNIVQLCNVLSKYLICHIHLAQGNKKEAVKVWNIPNWELNNRIKVAEEWGSLSLLKFHSDINTYLLNFIDSKSPEYKIRRLIFDISNY